ncbi:protein angel homolog 1-like [Leucoraja erinacea]|uniref:protein angel homolog 1-like n=1 Tax=Leucoraja erinaceus TaxID=7782 RepID=UPI002456549E|nr:protein angel homolog 1-like [Leucoraja erinacea]
MVGALLCYVLAPLAQLIRRITGPSIDEEDDAAERCSESLRVETDARPVAWVPLGKDQTALLQEWLHGGPGGESVEERGANVDAEIPPREAEEAAMTWQQAGDQQPAAAGWGDVEEPSVSAWHLSAPAWTPSSQGAKEGTPPPVWLPAAAQEAPSGWQPPSHQQHHQNASAIDWQFMSPHGTPQPVGGTMWHVPGALGMNEAPPNMLWQFQNEGNITTNSGQLTRTWENTTQRQGEDAGEGSPFEFTVMSYNILSQDLLETNCDLYSHCQPEFLKWEFRFQNIMQEFDTWDPDIMCLQEVQENHYHQQFQPALQLRGYECIYKRRTGIKTDGCAVCFKRDRFSLVSQHPVEYFRPIVETLNRDNVALLAVLRPAPPQTPDSGQDHPTLPDILVANTHLIFNPRRGDIKLTQLAVLLAEIQQLLQAAGGDAKPCPVILCGDLNSVPESPLYKLIRNGELYYYGMPTWKVSCQEDSSHQVCPRKLYGPLWPSLLRITDSCQYVGVCEKKTPGLLRYGREFLLQLRYSAPALQRPEHLELIAGVTDSIPEPPGDGSERYVSVPEPEDELFCKRSPTTIRHNLHLTSVYSHYQPDTGRPEVTTCSSGYGLTVDYIFYSAQPLPDKSGKGRRRYQDGALKLLGRLPLLSEHDVWMANGLPNALCSSDHLSLLARFGLQPCG